MLFLVRCPVMVGEICEVCSGCFVVMFLELGEVDEKHLCARQCWLVKYAKPNWISIGVLCHDGC